MDHLEPLVSNLVPCARALYWVKVSYTRMKYWWLGRIRTKTIASLLRESELQNLVIVVYHARGGVGEGGWLKLGQLIIVQNFQLRCIFKGSTRALSSHHCQIVASKHDKGHIGWGLIQIAPARSPTLNIVGRILKDGNIYGYHIVRCRCLVVIL